VKKKPKKDYWGDPIMAAKRLVIKDVYIPKDIRGKVEIYIKKNGSVAIRNIMKMKKITGKDLIKLGFEKQTEKPKHKPKENGYHYYTYEISEKCLLMSCSNDEKVDGGYEIEFYEIEDLKFNDLKQLKKLVKLLKSATNE